MNSQESDDPWEFYLYVALSLFHWDLDFFMNVTPNLFMKTYILYLKQHNPDAIEERQEVYMDEIPFWN